MYKRHKSSDAEHLSPSERREARRHREIVEATNNKLWAKGAPPVGRPDWRKKP